MNIKGKLIELLSLQTGMGKNGQWRKQDIVIETDTQYPKKVCISIWGDKINESQLKTGNVLTVEFDVESREYNGKWYTDIKAQKIQCGSDIVTPFPEGPTFGAPEVDDDDVLPF